jgi:hypothetical protein
MTSKTATPRPPSTRESAFLLRTTDENLRSHNGFQWPAKGYITCGDWNPRPVCGGGLHGLLHGKGDYRLLALDNPTAKWLVVRVRAKDVVAIDSQKVKVREGWVEFMGDGRAACAALLKLDSKADKKDLPFQQSAASGYLSQSAASGDLSQSAASGYRSQSAASGYLSQSAASGYLSQSAASGDLSQSAASGDRSQSAASGDLSQSAASGDRSQSAASGDRSQSAASGDLSQSAASGYLSQSAASGYRSQSAASG